jgi:hypothetical protein
MSSSTAAIPHGFMMQREEQPDFRTLDSGGFFKTTEWKRM